MARYRRIDIRMWGDRRFGALSPLPPCGQALWFYLLTGPETGIIPGLLRAGEAQMAEALGWPLEAFREAFREVSSQGMAKADWKARLVWVPNAIRYNQPESPNVVKSWAAAWDELPECAMKAEAFRHLKSHVEGMGEGFAKAFREALPDASVEGIPESGTGTGAGTGAGTPGGAGAVSPPPAAVTPLRASEHAVQAQPPTAPTMPSPLPEGDSLRDALEAGWRQRHGTDYAWRRRDEDATRELLALSGGDVAEVLRRWGVALVTTFPRCRGVPDLAQHWNAYGTPEPAAGAGPPGAVKRKGPTRAQDVDWSAAQEASDGPF